MPPAPGVLFAAASALDSPYSIGTPLMPLPTPICSCGCGRKCFDSYVERGQSARLVLPSGASIFLARKAECCGKFLSRRPDLCDQLRQHLLTAGKREGRGSGPWKRALRISEGPLKHPRYTLDSFAGSSPPADFPAALPIGLTA